MWTTTAEETNIYARSKIKTAHQGNDAIDAMTYFKHRQYACHNTWIDFNSVDIKIFYGSLDNYLTTTEVKD